MRRLFLCLVFFCANAHAATYTVDRTDDAPVSTCSATPNDCTLRGAVTKADNTVGADIVNFDATVFAAPGPHVIALTTKLPALTGNITITGPGAALLTVKEAGTNRLLSLFSVDSGVSATISGLTISNGSEGIANYGTLTATNCTFSGNNYRGLRNYGGTLTTINCTFSGNGGDGIGNIAGTLTATNCTLSGNGSNGIVNGAGMVTATNCILSGNSQTGIYNSGTMTATSCTISDNGYGILNSYGSTLTATNCTISGNSTGIRNLGDGMVTATGCTVSGNTDYGINNGGTLTVTGCTVSGNGIGINNGDTLTVTGCTVSGNGIGIYNYGGGTVTATNCTLSGNTYEGIYNEDSTATLTNCTVSGNTDYGIFNGGTLTLSNTLVAGNKTNVSGGFTNGGHNITSSAAAAGLDPAGLQDNGGPTKTIALLPGSPAIDAGNSTLTTDQRGATRPYDDPAVVNATGGNGSDIGAFELFVLGISVNNPRSLPEGSASAPGSITFDITLNGPSTQSVTVNYQTRDGINNPATAGVDYVEKHGKLTFAPGETLKRVTIQFIGDSVAEAKETFFLDLTTPTNATIADSRGVGTIVNDDAAALLFNSDEPSS